MDQLDFEQLDAKLKLDIPIVKQRTLEEQQRIETLKEETKSTMAAFAVGNLILNLFLAIGLKYLWNMVNLLQFIVFMRVWLVQIPIETDVFLESLKTLALFEFLPTDQIDDYFKEQMGIGGAPGEEKSIFDELAVVIIFACLVFLLLVLLVLLLACSKMCPKVTACFVSLKKKLFYGVFIRYVLLGSLKTQMTLCEGLAVGTLVEPTTKRPEKGENFIYGAVTMLTILNLAPFIFGLVLWRNKNNLDAPDVKQKIGALYELHNAKK